MKYVKTYEEFEMTNELLGFSEKERIASGEKKINTGAMFKKQIPGETFQGEPVTKDKYTVIQFYNDWKKSNPEKAKAYALFVDNNWSPTAGLTASPVWNEQTKKFDKRKAAEMKKITTGNVASAFD